MQRLWNSLILDPLRRIDAEQRDYLSRPESRRPDLKVIVVMMTAGLALTLQNYIDGIEIVQLMAGILANVGLADPAASLTAWTRSPHTEAFAARACWALWSFASYFFIPWLVIRLVFRERLADYGMKPHGALRDWPIYLVFFAGMLPLVWWVSYHENFQRTYPFYVLAPGEPLWPYFWAWEALYFLQFVGLEFFFRGFMVHGTKHRFGIYAIFVMSVPYTMIHFQKPMLETFGAMFAGVILGFMSLKTRSIWLGAAIHISVAATMDLLSLWQKGLL